MPTDEEIRSMQIELETLRAANEELTQSVSDLTAERDSLTEERAELIRERDTSREELQKTKQLNYTLARKVSTEPVQSFEDALTALVKRR